MDLIFKKTLIFQLLLNLSISYNALAASTTGSSTPTQAQIETAQQALKKELLEEIKSSDPEKKINAIVALQATKIPETIADLCRLTVQDPSTEIRLASMRALYNQGKTEESIKALEKALKDSDEFNQLTAAYILASFGDKESIDGLISLLNSKEDLLAVEAFEILDRCAGVDLERITTSNRGKGRYTINRGKRTEAIRKITEWWQHAKASFQFKTTFKLQDFFNSREELKTEMERQGQEDQSEVDKQSVEMLTKLKSSDPNERQGAALDCAERKSADAIPILTNMALADSNKATRLSAIYAIHLIDKKENAILTLQKLILDKDEEIQLRAAQYLVEFGKVEVMPLLIGAVDFKESPDKKNELIMVNPKEKGFLDSKQDYIVNQTLSTLEKFRGRKLREVMDIKQDSEDSENVKDVSLDDHSLLKNDWKNWWKKVRSSFTASSIVGNEKRPSINDETILPEMDETNLSKIRSKLESSDVQMRSSALDELSQFSALQFTSKLCEMAKKDPEIQIRMSALTLLSKQTSEKKVTELIKSLLNDPNEEIQKEAQNILQEISPEKTPGVTQALKPKWLEQLNSPSDDVRQNAVLELSESVIHEAVPVLTKIATADKNWRIRAGAVRALRKYPTNINAINALKQALSDQKEEVVEAAAVILVDLAEPDSISAFIRLLDSKNRDRVDTCIANLEVYTKQAFGGLMKEPTKEPVSDAGKWISPTAKNNWQEWWSKNRTTFKFRAKSKQS
jgi:HEAT repeat protein